MVKLPAQKIGVQFAVQPSSLKATLGSSAIPADLVTEVEFYVDYCCPFSKKMFLTLQELWPLLTASGDASVVFTMQQIVQPWHPQSCCVHEAALAARKLSTPDKYFSYSKVLFEQQEKFFDDATWGLNRHEIYEQLTDLAANVGYDRTAIHDQLKQNEEQKRAGRLNYGNAVTDEMKLITKLARKRGVHVSPTVYINGIEATNVSSGWSQDQWLDLLKDYGVCKK